MQKSSDNDNDSDSDGDDTMECRLFPEICKNTITEMMSHSNSPFDVLANIAILLGALKSIVVGLELESTPGSLTMDALYADIGEFLKNPVISGTANNIAANIVYSIQKADQSLVVH